MTNSEVTNLRIHSWDADAIITALFRSAVIEGFAIAPLAISGMGHAGPSGLLGWLSMLLNVPGLLIAGWLSNTWDFSWLGFISTVFLIQTAMLFYIMFFLIRRNKTKEQSL